MDGDGGDAAVVDEDRCLSLLDLRREKMDPRAIGSRRRHQNTRNRRNLTSGRDLEGNSSIEDPSSPYTDPGG